MAVGKSVITQKPFSVTICDDLMQSDGQRQYYRHDHGCFSGHRYFNLIASKKLSMHINQQSFADEMD